MTAFEARVQAARLNMPATLPELRKLLRNSKSRKFVKTGDVNTPVPLGARSRTVTCFIFETPAAKALPT